VKELFEFRMPERLARSILGDATERFRLIPGDPRIIRVSVSDPVFETLRGAAKRRSVGTSHGMFYSWDVRRSYSPAELEAAELIHMLPVGAFEPEGEECGTEYDDSPACPYCGAGRIQRTPLALDLRSRQPDHDIHTSTLRRGKDLARSIAEEVVASDRFVASYESVGGTGARFDPVLRCRSGRPIDGWHQVVVTSPPVDVTEPTGYGVDPFDPDAAGEFRCPVGHVLGLNLLTELTIARDSWRGDDIVATRQLSGRREGVLVPAPEYLISPRLYRALREAGARGMRFEVAHLS